MKSLKTLITFFISLFLAGLITVVLFLYSKIQLTFSLMSSKLFIFAVLFLQIFCIGLILQKTSTKQPPPKKGLDERIAEGRGISEVFGICAILVALICLISYGYYREKSGSTSPHYIQCTDQMRFVILLFINVLGFGLFFWYLREQKKQWGLDIKKDNETDAAQAAKALPPVTNRLSTVKASKRSLVITLVVCLAVAALLLLVAFVSFESHKVDGWLVQNFVSNYRITFVVLLTVIVFGIGLILWAIHDIRRRQDFLYQQQKALSEALEEQKRPLQQQSSYSGINMDKETYDAMFTRPKSE